MVTWLNCSYGEVEIPLKSQIIGNKFHNKIHGNLLKLLVDDGGYIFIGTFTYLRGPLISNLVHFVGS